VGSINHESQVVVEQQGNRLARSFYLSEETE